MRLFSWILLLPLSIRCIGSMGTSWGMLILFIAVLLVFRHVSGAYLVILRKGDNKKGEEDGMIIAFLVRLMLELLLFLAEEGWGVENAFRSLEEFGVRTCDVRKELVLILLCYFLLNVWFLVRSWRRVRLWEFCQSLVDFLP